MSKKRSSADWISSGSGASRQHLLPVHRLPLRVRRFAVHHGHLESIRCISTLAENFSDTFSSSNFGKISMQKQQINLSDYHGQ
jgi:hypothetical protein